MTFDVNAPLQDRQAEAVFMTLMEEAPKVLANPSDYEARANIMWCATNALNGFMACGVPQDWVTHMIGHELTALYGLDHAQTLAVVLPSVLRHQKARKMDKLIKMGRRVFGINSASVDEAAEATIQAIEKFFLSIGMPVKLSAYGINAIEAADKVCEKLKPADPHFGEHEDITPEMAKEILKLS
jgi:NADP-dependent alcohol dehydrogenase